MLTGTVSVSPSDEFMLSDSSDNLVAYRIVHVPDESKDQQLFEATTSSGSAAAPQQVQYFVIDNSNGIVQAVQSPQITVTTAAASATAAPAKSDSASGTSKSPKARTSIAIAPKATVTKSNVNVNGFYACLLPSWKKCLRCLRTSFSSSRAFPAFLDANTNRRIACLPPIQTSELLNSLRKRDEKRDDRRRATHNEVERRRRDKINHWIMKLGSIIPADGKAHEIGTSGRISIAAIEGQSKGGILSKAFEYVQTLQTKRGADG